MRFISYAQEGEDLILYVPLKDIHNGFYIDIGANDPMLMNVTKAFYDRGWSGINIEPLISMCKLLEVERERDINLCLGVGSKEGELELTCNGMCSTFSSKVVKENSYSNKKAVPKKIMTITQIYRQYCALNQEVHFCKIDVEGFEKEVLLGVDFNVFRPWIYAIESAKPGTDIDCYDEWEYLLYSNDYILAYTSNINRFYVDRRKEYLLESFNEIEKFKRENEIVKVVFKEF